MAASYVCLLAMSSCRSTTSAPRWLRVVWAAVAAIIAFIVVQLGGAKAVRSVCYIAGLPLAVIAFFIMYAVYKMLKTDYRRKSKVPFVPEENDEIVKK